MLRFCLKKILIGPLLGEIGLFCVYSDYAEQTNFCELGKIFQIFQISKVPFIFANNTVVFPKFDSLTAVGIALYRKMSKFI
jgi:hypothetical protein